MLNTGIGQLVKVFAEPPKEDLSTFLAKNPSSAAMRTRAMEIFANTPALRDLYSDAVRRKHISDCFRHGENCEEFFACTDDGDKIAFLNTLFG